MDSQRQDRGHQFLPPPEVLSQIPGSRQTESTATEDKTIWLHYFSAASDHYIAEVWQEPESQSEPDRWMGFGYARFAAFPDLAEWGYIDLDELEQVRVEGPGGLPVIVERDLPWQPKPFREIQSEAVGAPTARHERSPAAAAGTAAEPTAAAAGLAEDQAMAEAARAEADDIQHGEPGWTEQRADVATSRERSGFAPDAHVMHLDPPPSMRTRWDAGNAADAGPAEQQIFTRNEASGYQNDAYDYDADREAGE